MKTKPKKKKATTTLAAIRSYRDPNYFEDLENKERGATSQAAWEYYFDNTIGSEMWFSGSDGATGISCGVTQLSELGENHSPKVQAQAILRAMEHKSNWNGNDPESIKLRGTSYQVLLSDTMDMQKTIWAATKRIAYRGPITVNPNSGNRIRVYIVTAAMLPLIFNAKD